MAHDGTARLATAKDAPALARLAERSFRAKFGHLYPAAVLEAYVAETYSEPALAELIANPSVRAWVVGPGEDLLAYAVLGACKLPHPAVSARCIELRRLYTAPEATGQGLGTALMAEVMMPAVAEAAARGGDAWLGVYSDNAGAQRFYRRWGFVQAGEYEFPVGPLRDREFILRRPR